MVEDDPAVGKVVCGMLERAGYVPELVGTTAAMLERVESGDKYDALLSDIHLPDDDKLEFLVKLEEMDHGRLPIILITGAPTVETAVEALRHGVVDYLRKPVRSEDIVASVEKALGWRRALESVENAQRNAEAWLRSLQAAGEVLRHGPLPASDLPTPPPPQESLLVQRLSAREREIVEHLSSGRRVPEIATTLTISPNTVRNHLKSVFRKLGVSSQVELLSLLAGGSG